MLPTCYISDAIASEPLTLKRLLPATADEIVAGFGLDGSADLDPAHPASRPRVMLNMVSTADGHATLDGRSGPISGPADRALFHGLRLAVDAVMAGAGTVRTERYGRIVPDASRRQTRVARGLSEEPLACIVSGRLALEGDIPLLADPAARVVILTQSSASLPAGATAAEIDYIRAARDGQLDLTAALAELHDALRRAHAAVRGRPPPERAAARRRARRRAVPLALPAARRRRSRSESRPPRGAADPRRARVSTPARSWSCAACSSTTPRLFLRYSVRDRSEETGTAGAGS